MKYLAKLLINLKKKENNIISGDNINNNKTKEKNMKKKDINKM